LTVRHRIIKIGPRTYQRTGSRRPRPYESRGCLRVAAFLVARSLNTLATRQKKGNKMSQQQQAVELVMQSGFRGLTSNELSLIIGVNVHRCGSLLSKAHRDKSIYRVGTKRDGQKIYLSEEYLNGKTHQPYGFGGSKIKLKGTWSELAQKSNTVQDQLPIETSIVLFKDDHFTLTWRP